MEIAKLSPHLRKLDEAVQSIFGCMTAAPARITYSIECRNPVAFSKIHALVDKWADEAHFATRAAGVTANSASYPAAYVDDHNQDCLQLQVGNPALAIKMFDDIGDEIRRIRHEYPPIAAGTDYDGVTAFDRTSLRAAEIPFDDHHLNASPPNQPSHSSREAARQRPPFQRS